MGHESFINKILGRSEAPIQTPDREPTPDEQAEMEELLARMRKQQEVPVPDNLDKEARLAKSREILRQIVARAHEEEGVNGEKPQAKETYKWEDTPNRGGNNRAANM